MSPRLLHFLKIVLTAAVYFVLAKLSLYLQFQYSNATPVWPASGFAFVIILLGGTSLAPGIMLGAFSANIAVFIENQTVPVPIAILISAVISIGNTGEALAGYYIVKRTVEHTGINNFLTKVNHVFRFFFAAAVMSIVSSVIGATIISAAHIITWNQSPLVWFTWWLGDVSGILIITPFILSWTSWFKSATINFGSIDSKKTAEALVLFIVMLLTCGVVFEKWFFDSVFLQWAFWLIPVLAWGAIRFSQRIAVTVLLLMSVMAIGGALHRDGPFSALELNEALLTTEAFVSIMVITKLALNASVIERKATEAELRDTGSQLEVRVQQRTAELQKSSSELQEKNKELEKINEELASFTYVASHDMQEPLRKIQLFAKRLVEKEADNLTETGKDYFNRMQSAAERMQNLIEDLLVYSRTNASDQHFVISDLNVILEEVKAELKERITESNVFISADHLPEVSLIPYQFHQLLINLISNSIKFSREDVTPEIQIKYEIIDGLKIRKEEPSKKYLHLYVRDNGIGFDPEFSEQIFGLFQRLHPKSEYTGTGIGLAICKKIVENHNGVITANSEPGKGATFNIYLPV